ncbi:unnamed protein product [Ostreobium quekettii]|uniref:MADS-box domain-containing protein n=1 Tax=Ostreobium quekettii TaxID=121088 RepID=A0A8S1JAE9_9CHLO|nr:unnamed protein product [Ostreobium quekettii]
MGICGAATRSATVSEGPRRAVGGREGRLPGERTHAHGLAICAVGRKKIRIEKIQDERARQVTFTKRKNGLMKKAMELSILCDCEIALVVFNSSGKLFEYSSGSIDGTIERFGRHRAEPHEVHDNTDLFQHYFAEELALFDDDDCDGTRRPGGKVRSDPAVVDVNRQLRGGGSTLEVARQLGWTVEDGHHALSPRSETAHKAIAMDLEKVFGVLKAISGSNQAGDSQTRAADVSGRGEHCEENDQDLMLADPPDLTMSVAVGMKRKLEPDAHGPDKESAKTDHVPDKGATAVAGLRTSAQMAAALLSNSMGHSQAMSSDDWKTVVATMPAQQGRKVGNYSSTANRSGKQGPRGCNAMPKTCATLQQAHVHRGNGAQQRRTWMVDRSATSPQDGHSNVSPVSNPTSNNRLERHGGRCHTQKMLACKQELPFAIPASQMPRHILPVVGYTDGTDGTMSIPQLGACDQAMETHVGAKGGQILTLVQTPHGFFAVPLQLKAGVGLAAQCQELERAGCAGGDPAVLALQDLNNGAACQPTVEGTPDRAMGGNVSLMTANPCVVVKPTSIPAPQIVVASQGFPLVLTEDEHGNSQNGDDLSRLSQTELSHVGNLIRQMQVSQREQQINLPWAPRDAATADGATENQAFSVGVTNPTGEQQLQRTLLLQMASGRPRQDGACS